MDLHAWLTALPAAPTYLLLALLVGVESMGIPLPGETALITVAVLAAQPGVTLSTVVVWLVAAGAAIVGDTVGYVVGRRLGPSALEALARRFPRHVTPVRLRFAEHLMATRGAVTVFGGRFVAVLRMLAGPLAGALHLRYPVFLMANASGALAWSGLVVGLATLAGATAHQWLVAAGWGVLALAAIVLIVGGRSVGVAFDRSAERYAGQTST